MWKLHYLQVKNKNPSLQGGFCEVETQLAAICGNWSNTSLMIRRVQFVSVAALCGPMNIIVAGWTPQSPSTELWWSNTSTLLLVRAVSQVSHPIMAAICGLNVVQHHHHVALAAISGHAQHHDVQAVGLLDGRRWLLYFVFKQIGTIILFLLPLLSFYWTTIL